MEWDGSEFLLGHTGATPGREDAPQAFSESPGHSSGAWKVLQVFWELLWQAGAMGPRAGSEGRGCSKSNLPGTARSASLTPLKLHPAPPRAAPLGLNTLPSQGKPG